MAIDDTFAQDDDDAGFAAPISTDISTQRRERLAPARVPMPRANPLRFGFGDDDEEVKTAPAPKAVASKQLDFGFGDDDVEAAPVVASPSMTDMGQMGEPVPKGQGVPAADLGPGGSYVAPEKPSPTPTPVPSGDAVNSFDDAPFRSGGTVLDKIAGSTTGMLSPAEAYDEKAKEAAAAKAAADNTAEMARQARELAQSLPDDHPEKAFWTAQAQKYDRAARAANAGASKAANASPATQGGLRDTGERILRTAGGAAVSSMDALRGIVDLSSHPQEVDDPTLAATRAKATDKLRETSKAAQQAVTRGATPDPTQDEDFGSKLTEGATSMGMFMAGGVAGRMLGLPGALASGGLGALQQGGQGFVEAEAAIDKLRGKITATKQMGGDATKDEAALEPLLRNKYIALFANMGLGASEAIPIERFFNRLNQLSNGRVGHILTNTTAQSLEEVVQEIGQTVGSNVVANLYEAEGRNIFKGVGESAAVAGVLGGLMGAGAGMTGRRGSDLNAPLINSPNPNVPPSPEEVAQAAAAAAQGSQSQTTVDINNGQTATASTSPSPDSGTPPVEAENSTIPQDVISDPYEQAVEIVRRDGKVSTSYIQRQLQLGYSAAAAIVERMEKEGIVGPANHAGRREVLETTKTDISDKISTADHALLRGYGYNDEQIGAMSPIQLMAELADARESGTEPDDTTGEITASDEDSIVFGDDDAEVGGRGAAVEAETGAEIAAVADQVAEPTEAQKAAGNYRKGHIKFAGLDVTIENPKGSTRSGTDANGQPWTSTLPGHYGYVKRTKGGDGENVDILIGDHAIGDKVWIIDQIDPVTGKWDEHKVMAGVRDAAEARAMYEAQFPDGSGAVRARDITEVSVDRFKRWLKNGDAKKAYAPPPKEVKRAEAKNTGKPLSLLQYIASRGGIKPDADLRAIGLSYKDRAVVPNKGPRSVLSGKGLDLDAIREALYEGGYIAWPDPNQPEDSGVHRQIYDMIAEELRGRKQWPLGQEPDPSDDDTGREHAQAAYEDNIETVRKMLLEEGPIVDTPMMRADIDLAAQLMIDERLDVDSAYERAVLQNALTDEVVTEQEVADIYGEDSLDEIRPGQAYGDGEVRQDQDQDGDDAAGEGEARPSGPSDDAVVEESGEGRLDDQQDTVAAATEQTDAGEQTVIPGAEKIGDGDLAQIKADEPLKPKKNQKPADEGLFGDDSKQTDLLDAVAEKPKPIRTKALEPAADSAIVPVEESSDGIQVSVHAGDARPSAEDVQGTVQERPTGTARPEAGSGSESDVRGTDEGRPEGAGGVPSPAVREGSRGEGEGRPDRVSAGRADSGVKGENYSIEPGALDEGRSFKIKAQDNIRAIELVRQIEAEARPATRAEQEQLARYVGWGGIKGAFPDGDGAFGKGFEGIGAKLKELLSEEEYSTARRSIQYAHYTAEGVVREMWRAVERMGFTGGKVFEPGMGVGNFAGMMPADIAAATDYSGLELDGTTARIAKLLYPRWGIRNDDFTRSPLPENTFDVVIGNPPFADVAIKSDPKYKQGFLLHDYFFAKSLDAVRPGGLLAFISSAGTMNKIDTKARDYMADRADFLGAIRLPGNAFKENAGTEVTTDIIFLRKRLPDEAPGDRAWTETVEATFDGITGAVNRYFSEHPEMVLGEQGFFDKLYEGRYAVRASKGFDLKAELAKAIDALPSDVMSSWSTATDHAIDFETTEKKEGTFYLAGVKLMQVRGGVGVAVDRRGKGVEGGRTEADIQRIQGIIPVRDALRAVYAADMAEDSAAADKARASLNKHYDAFVAKFGPINKADLQRRRPTVVQQESARQEAREEARYAGLPFDEGSFNPSELIREKATLAQIARARKEAREQQGADYREGNFNADEMPDVIIDRRPNIDPFMDDPESYRLRAVEHYNNVTNKASKGAVFFENIITKERPPEIKSTNDAVLHVLNQHGRVDIQKIAGLAGKSETQVLEDLGDRIFLMPGTRDTYQTKQQYLSGDVVKKLEIARAAAERHPAFKRNVAALEAAQPMPLAPSQIHAQLGMPWLPQETIEEFGREALGLDTLRVTYTPKLANWTVSGDTGSAAATTTWGTQRIAAPALIQAALNRQSVKIYDKTKDESVLNVAATQAANEKVAAIREKFADWIWSDQTRADKLASFYNLHFNNLVAAEYDGSYLTTPGIAKGWSWRPHQTRVIARIIQEGNTYMAHAVGAGKTSAMIGAGMEMRRLGLVRKPMYAVPNHMLAQFTKEFYEQYPTARIAVADERRFHTDRRKQFIANVANEDLDAVIITHSAFGMIPVEQRFQDKLIEDELDQYRDILADLKGPDTRITRSRVEKQIERLEQRLSARGNKAVDQVFTFQEMGVDFLFVDEAHLFRKLDFSTQMSNLKGITPDGSNASWDLYVKTRYLESVNPGRGLVLASGTPVTNTMAELFTVSRYLQRQTLEERQLEAFDAWAGAFGESVTELEQDAAGGYKPQTRFAKFVNVAELSVMVRQVMDVVTSRQLEQYVVRPKLKGGKRVMNLAEKSDALADFQESLKARMVAIQNRKGPPAKGDDIMLSVINDGRHAAIDMRLAGAGKSEVPSKLDLMVENVFRIWKETRAQPFHKTKDGKYEAKPYDRGPATQMIFANLGLSGKRGFAVPDYIRSELVRRGVPKNEIAFIYDFNTHVAKQRLFNDMNDGKVRVLIGSTAKMATGVNAQRRLSAIHNLDPLWYPADDEQRNGRGIRQGNQNPEIEINDYSTKGTYDSTMWGLMEKKARFIQGFFEGDPSLRDMDDLGEASQYEQAKAITTNDPRLIRLTELRQELEKARRRAAAFDQEKYGLRQRRARETSSLEYATTRIEQVREDVARHVDTTGDKFKGTIGSKTYTKRVDFGEAMLMALESTAEKGASKAGTQIGEISSFPILATVRKGEGGTLTAEPFLQRSGNFETDIDGSSALGMIRSIENTLNSFKHDLTEYQRKADAAKKFLTESAKAAEEVFSGGDKINELVRQVRELEAELAPPPPPPVAEAGNSNDADENKGRETGPSDSGDLASLARLNPSPSAARSRQKVENDLGGIIERLVGRRVRVEFPDTIPVSAAAREKWGSYRQDAPRAAGRFSVRQGLVPLIQVAMTEGDFEGQRSTAFHESFHAVQKLLLTDDELSILIREDGRLRAYIAENNASVYATEMTPAQVAELSIIEVQAIAFELYVKKLEQGDFSPGLRAAVQRLLARIRRVLRQVKNYLHGHGFNTSEGIFEAIYEGKLSTRADVLERSFGGRDADYLALRPRTVRPRSGNLPYPLLEMPAETVREALNDPTLTTRERLSTALDALLLTPARAIWDTAIDLARLQRASELMNNGQSTPENLDTYLAATLYPGRAGERMKDASRKLFEPIYDAMKANNVKRAELHEYLYARHAQERNAQIRTIDPNNDAGSGMTDADAQAILAGAAARQADYDAVAALVDGVVGANRALMEREGLEHPRTLLAWEQAYQHYVPLKGAEAEEGEQGSPSTGKGYMTRGPESRRALGRFDKAADIMTNLLDQTQRTIIRAEKNKVAKTFLRFAQRNPSALYKQGLAETRRQINPQTGLVETVWVTTSADRENVFAAKVGGETYYLRIEHEGLLLALKSIGADRLNPFFRLIGRMTRQYSAFQTARNPDFFLSNLFRDLGDAGLNITAEQKRGFHRAFAKHFASGRSLLAAVLGQNQRTNNRYGRLYEEWRLAGGKISTFGWKDIDAIRRDIDRELSQRTESTTKSVAMAVPRFINPFGGKLVSYIEAVSEVLESTTRLAVYSAARDVGMSKADAARAARTVTVDFNARGKYGPALSAFYAFANPAIQGTVGLARRLRKSRGMRIAAGGVVSLGFVMALWNMWAGGDDEEKKNNYAKRAYWEREKNFIIMFPGQKEALKIPLGYGLQPFYMLGEQSAMVLMGKTKPLEALGNWLGTVAHAFNPFSGEGSIASFHYWIGTMTPTMAEPIIDLGRNRNWLNRPIHPDPMPWTRGVPRSEQSKLTTSTYAESAAKALNAISGGDKFTKGMLDTYPDDLAYAWNFALGGYGKFLTQGANLAADKFAGVDTPVEQVPVIRRFILSTRSEALEAAAYGEAVFKASEQAQAVRNAIRTERETGSNTETERTIRDLGAKVGLSEGPRGGVRLDAEVLTREAGKELKALRFNERAAKNDPSMSREQSSARIKELRVQAQEVMARTRRAIERMNAPP